MAMTANLLTISTSLTIPKQILKLTSRKRSVWTHDRVIKSPYTNIEVPNCTLYDYVWQNLHKWPERTASKSNCYHSNCMKDIEPKPIGKTPDDLHEIVGFGVCKPSDQFQVCALTGRGYTYAEAFKLSQTFAANLRSKLSVRSGDTVAVMLPNVPEYPLIALAALGAGAVIASFLPIYTTDEVQRQLTLLAAKVVVTSPELHPTVTEALRLAKLSIPVVVVKANSEPAPPGAALFSELSEDVHVDKSCLRDVTTNANDTCFVLYSSGTTGHPKGVELSHANIIANLEQINEPLIRCHNETTAYHQDAVMCARPLCHVTGTSMLTLHKLSVGAKLVVLNMTTPEVYLRTLQNHKTNVVMVTPPHVHLMGSHPAATEKTYEHVEILAYGGLPINVGDVQRFCDKAKRNVDIRHTYGMTETSPMIALTPKGLNSYAQTGPPLPSTKIRVVNEALNNLGPNEKGEILVRGPQVMRGYRNNPQANNEVFTADGWLRTGDLGLADEQGILTVAERLKELIKANGCPVPPAELESFFREHPSVVDAGVVGISDPIKGEKPKAFLVLKRGHKCTERELLEYVNQKVSPHKRVDDVMFIDEIPRTVLGKILRRVLKEKYS